MTMQSDGAQPEATLKPGAIGFVSSMVIGLASTSPAYSLAAIIGPMVALVGIYAPGALLASFVPMLLIASAFYYLNRVDSDCGTTFSWVTRSMGPWFGWLGGWAIGMTGVLVVGSLANVGVTYFLLAFGADDLAENDWVVKGLTVALIIVMTAICVIGTELSAHFQDVLIIAQVLALLAFAGTALYGGLSGTSTASTDLGDFVATTPEFSLAQSLRCRRSGPDRGAAARRLRLLGLGVRGQPQRGDRGGVLNSGPGSHRLDRRAAGDLRRGGRRRRLLCRGRFPDRQRRGGGGDLRHAGRPGDGRLVVGGAAGGVDLGNRLHPDHHHSGVPHRSVDGPPARDAQGAGAHPPTLPHPGCLHLDRRRHRDRLVPG